MCQFFLLQSLSRCLKNNCRIYSTSFWQMSTIKTHKRTVVLCNEVPIFLIYIYSWFYWRILSHLASKNIKNERIKMEIQQSVMRGCFPLKSHQLKKLGTSDLYEKTWGLSTKSFFNSQESCGENVQLTMKEKGLFALSKKYMWLRSE